MIVMNKQLSLSLVAIALPILLQAQAPLIPVWSNTWPYGQDEQPVPAPVSADNHVAVDATTSNVYVSVDDQMELVSTHFDRLFAFDAAGIDITNPPTSLLGTANPTVNDPPNLESTHDLTVRENAVYHMRELNTGFNSGTTGSLHRMNLDGTWGWKLGLGKAGFNYGNGVVLVDDQGAIAVRSLDGYTAALHATSPDGWPLWSKMYPAFGPFQDAVIIGNTIVAAYYGSFVTIDRATGAQLQSNVVYLPSLAPKLATDGTRVYFAYTDFAGNSTWGGVVPGNTPLWTRTAALGMAITELEVDAFGRPWFTGNATDGVSAPLLVITASDGSTHDLFTYGTSMNDLAMGDGQAYITGRLDNTSTTYLISVGTDVTTSVETPIVDTSIRLYPQPASTSITIANVTGLKSARVIDLTGQPVHAPAMGTNAIDVSKLSNGVYFLEAKTAQGRIAKRFVVAR